MSLQEQGRPPQLRTRQQTEEAKWYMSASKEKEVVLREASFLLEEPSPASISFDIASGSVAVSQIESNDSGLRQMEIHNESCPPKIEGTDKINKGSNLSLTKLGSATGESNSGASFSIERSGDNSSSDKLPL